MDILTVLIGSLCDNSIRTSAHFRVSRHIDRVSGVLFEIGQNNRLIGEIRMRQVDHSGDCINLDTRVVDGVVQKNTIQVIQHWYIKSNQYRCCILLYC